MQICGKVCRYKVNFPIDCVYTWGGGGGVRRPHEARRTAAKQQGRIVSRNVPNDRCVGSAKSELLQQGEVGPLVGWQYDLRNSEICDRFHEIEVLSGCGAWIRG